MFQVFNILLKWVHVCFGKTKNKRYIAWCFSVSSVWRGKTDARIVQIQIGHSIALECRQLELKGYCFPYTQTYSYSHFYLLSNCWLPNTCQLKFSVIEQVVNKTFLKSRWGYQASLNTTKMRLLLASTVFTFCQCVRLGTDLSLSYVQRESLGNKMLDTNESGLLALTLSREGGDPGRRCMLCV